ncbi:MAG: ABC transporter substrate-binding protein [Alphaproteobacteria bacterium]
MRRILMLGVTVAGVALAAPSFAQEKLVVAIYGGNWGTAIEKCVFQPFTAATGIGVTSEPSVSTVTRSKLQQQKGSPALDAVWIDGGISELAMADGTVGTLDPKRIPNLANVIDEGVYKRKDGSIYAASTGFYAVGLTYNTKEVKEVPTSWWDLWKKEYEGKVIIPSPVNAAGIPFFLTVNKAAGGDVKNVQPGVDRLKTLKVSSYYDASGQGASNFQSGEAIIGAHYATAAWGLADQGLPIAYAVPKEGAPSSDIRIHLVEGTKKKDSAEKLINFAISKEAATCLSENLYVGPATKGVTLTDKAKSRMPWGPNGTVKSLFLPNWEEVNANRDRLTEIWNKQVAGK